MKMINQDLRVHAVTFQTKDPEKLAAFYQQAFNIPVAEKVDKDHYGVQLKNLYLAFDSSKEAGKDKEGGPVIWFYTENVEETFTHIVSMGAQVRTNVDKDERPGQSLAVLYDPDGNLFGLIGPSIPQGEL